MLGAIPQILAMWRAPPWSQRLLTEVGMETFRFVLLLALSMFGLLHAASEQTKSDGTVSRSTVLFVRRRSLMAFTIWHGCGANL